MSQLDYDILQLHFVFSGSTITGSGEVLSMFKRQRLLVRWGVLSLFAVTAQADNVERVADLVTPVMTEEAPVAGKRVRQVAPEYDGTGVYHSLYLPVDWKPGGKYPVIVEYPGNKLPPASETSAMASPGESAADGGRTKSPASLCAPQSALRQR